MVRILIFIMLTILYGISQAKEDIAKPGYCYSILTEVDFSTPVSENYFKKDFFRERCTLFEKPFIFSDKKAYVGCYRKKRTAEEKLQTLNFNFKNPKIVLHKIYDGTPYVIFPQKSTVNPNKALIHLNKIYKEYTIDKVLKKFPNKYYGSTLEIYDLEKADFLPTINLYPFYQFNGKNAKILLIRDGVYSLETIYKLLKNDKYIKKLNNKTYLINIPIVVMPTASLVIKNKTVLLQTKPKSIFIMYYGNLYIANSKIFTWDARKNSYCPREKVPKEKILYTNYEKPRPYILGLRGSKGYFVNSIFRGLGFHSTSATFGLAVLSPKMSDYYPVSKAFYYFVSSSPAPTGAYIGNDIYDGTMAFYTNGGKNIVYLGNYTYDNVIYNFDPHDYSTGLVIARNLATRAKMAHGIIISRGCNNNYITENISIGNKGNGIMIDRQSNHNFIYNNLTFGNGLIGISSIESKDILVKDNLAVGNNVDGIMVRNTLRFQAENNKLLYNAKNGIEVIVKDIDNIPGRDLARDPYAKAASAIIVNNNIKNNYNSNIMVKNGAAVQIKDNYIPYNIGIAGDLNFFYNEIIKNKGNFKLYGLGFPFSATSTDLLDIRGSLYKTAQEIFLDIAKIPNDFFGTHLAGLYIEKEPIEITKAELIRAASRLSQGALRFLGFVYLTEAKKENYKDEKKVIEGLSYIIEDAILSNNIASYRDIDKARLFIPNGESYIEKAFNLAKKRMEKGILFEQRIYDTCYVCNQTPEEKSRIISAFKLFSYNYNQVQAKSFLDYCKVLFKNYTIFTTPVKKHFDILIREKNDVKDSVNRYYKRIYRLAKKDKLCSRYLEKQIKDSRKIKRMMINQKSKMIELIRPKVEELVKKINQYRIRKLSVEGVLNLIINSYIYNEEDQIWSSYD